MDHVTGALQSSQPPSPGSRPSDDDEKTIISPAIMYWGTPVVLISSKNEDGTVNIAPMSSAFWLAHTCVVGLGAGSKTPGNILRTGECVLNLPDDTMLDAINALSGTTGSEDPGDARRERGYVFVKDKWSHASLSSEPSDFVAPSRIRECPVQMECRLTASHPLMRDIPDRKGLIVALELRILRTHIKEDLRMERHANRVDPAKWRPMIMSFQQLYGLQTRELGHSKLGEISEEKYRKLTQSDVVQLPGAGDAGHANVR